MTRVPGRAMLPQLDGGRHENRASGLWRSDLVARPALGERRHRRPRLSAKSDDVSEADLDLDRAGHRSGWRSAHLALAPHHLSRQQLRLDEILAALDQHAGGKSLLAEELRRILGVAHC